MSVDYTIVIRQAIGNVSCISLLLFGHEASLMKFQLLASALEL